MVKLTLIKDGSEVLNITRVTPELIIGLTGAIDAQTEVRLSYFEPQQPEMP